MPDKSAAKPDSAMESDDLFGADVPEKTRVKRHTLNAPNGKPRPATEAVTQRDFSRSASPAPEPTTIAPNLKDEINSKAKLTEPETASTRPVFASTAKPSPAAKSAFRAAPAAVSAASAPASGTLYYSTGAKTEKEKEIPMTTPAASSASTSASRPATVAAASTRPAATPAVSTPRPVATPSTGTRPPSAVDYRANMERQAKEQKSMGGVLAILVYSLIALFVLGAGLAGFGAYALSKQIRQQSLTIGELDKHYAEQSALLTAQLKATNDSLTQAQADIGKQQQLIQQQQATLTKTTAIAEQLSSSLQAERQARAGETAALRTRLRSLENRELGTH